MFLSYNSLSDLYNSLRFFPPSHVIYVFSSHLGTPKRTDSPGPSAASPTPQATGAAKPQIPASATPAPLGRQRPRRFGATPVEPPGTVQPRSGEVRGCVLHGIQVGTLITSWFGATGPLQTYYIDHVSESPSEKVRLDFQGVLRRPGWGGIWVGLC